MTGTPQVFYPRHLMLPPPAHQPQSYLDFKVTTPLFYAQIIRFAHLSEFFTASLLTAAPEEQMFYVSDPSIFVSLFESQANNKRFEKDGTPRSPTVSSVNMLRWQLLYWLRNHSPRRLPPTPPLEGPSRVAHDIRSFSFSHLDEYAIQSLDTSRASAYRRAVIKVLMSDIVAFGQPALIEALYTAIRILLCWVFVLTLRKDDVLPAFGASIHRGSETATDGLWNTASLSWRFCGLHLLWGLRIAF